MGDLWGPEARARARREARGLKRIQSRSIAAWTQPKLCRVCKNDPDNRAKPWCKGCFRLPVDP